MSRYSERTVQWGHWGITLMNPQPDPTKNFGEIVATVSFPVGNCGPVDGTFGSEIRLRYKEMCDAWVKDGVLPQSGITKK